MGKSSKDRRDIYYRAAKECGYRARSAFKLLQIDRRFHLLDGVSRVVDLCAAPGGWSEVVAARLFPPSPSPSSACSSSSPPSSASASVSASAPVIIAVDLAPMLPLPHVQTIRADITAASTLSTLLTLLSPPQLAELVLCDAAPDSINQHDVDAHCQHALLLSALSLSLQLLAPGAAFLCKVWRSAELPRLSCLCLWLFHSVTLCKPRCSRNGSMEAFVLCQGFRADRGRGGAVINADSLLRQAGWRDEEEEEEAGGRRRFVLLFVSCGDEMDLDADQTYPLSFRIPTAAAASSSSSAPPAAASAAYAPLAPSALPIDPPYKKSLALQRQRHSAGCHLRTAAPAHSLARTAAARTSSHTERLT